MSKTKWLGALSVLALGGFAPNLAWSAAAPPVAPCLTITSTINGITIESCQPISASNPMPISGTFSATLSGFLPTPSYATLSVGAASSSVALPGGTSVIVYNTGTHAAFVKLGDSSVTASAGNDAIQPGSWLAFTVGANTYLAAIEVDGATSLNLSGGAGLPTGAGGGSGGSGGGGAITAPLGHGTADASAVSVVPSATASFPITAAALPLPSGAATSALQTTGNTSLGTIITNLGTPMQNSGGSVTANLGTLGGAATNAELITINGTLGTPMQQSGGSVTLTQTGFNALTGGVAIDSSHTLFTQIVGNSNIAYVDGSHDLLVTCSNCSGTGASATDNLTGFSPGTSVLAPTGGFYQATVTSNPATAGNLVTAQMTHYRALMTDWYNASGVEMGTTGSPVNVALPATPALASGSGVVIYQGGALSATNGLFTNVLQGNAVLTAANPLPSSLSIGGTAVGATNGLYTNLLQGNAVLAAGNPIFVSPGTSAVFTTSISQTTPGTTNGVALEQIGSTTIKTGVSASSAGTQQVALSTDTPGEALANPSWTYITDGTSTASVKAASTSATATDKSLVVQINPQQTPPMGVSQVNGAAFSASNPLFTQLDIGGSAIGATNGVPVTPATSASFTVAQATAGNLNATVVQGTASNLKATANVLGSGGAAMDIAQGGATAAADALQVAGVYNPSLSTLTTGQAAALQLTSAGDVKVSIDNCVSGVCPANVSNASSGVATSATNSPVVSYLFGFNGTTWDQLQVDGSKYLKVNCTNCSGSVSAQDNSAWTSALYFNPFGGLYQTSATSNPLSAGNQGFAQLTHYRALMTDWYNSSGTEMGTSGSPVQVSLANTGSNATAVLVTGTGGTFPAALNGSPSVANGNGVVLYQGGVLSATNGIYTNVLQGNAVLAVGNPSFTELSDGSAALSTTSHVLNVNATIAANQSVNVAQINGHTAVEGGVNGSQGVGGLAGNGAAIAGNPVTVAGWDNTDARTLLTDTAGRLAVIPYQGTTVLSVTNPSFTEVTDGTHAAAATKAASTAAIATDPALVVAVSPNNVVTVQGGIASGATQTSNPLPDGGRAETAEPTAVTDGQAVAAAYTSLGKAVVQPYAIGASEVDNGGTDTTGSAAAITVLSASGNAAYYEYMTSAQCTRDDAGTTGDGVVFSDGTKSRTWVMPNNGGGGGFTMTFPVPIKWALNHAVTATPNASVTGNISCNAQGYIAP